MAKARKTAIEGVYSLENRRFKLKTTANHPDTGKRVARERIVEGITLNQAARVRERMREELIASLQAPSGARLVGLNRPLTTIGDWAEQWIEDKASELRKGTVETYVDALAKRVLPSIGHLPIGALDRRLVKRWVGQAEAMTKPNGEVFAKATMHIWFRVFRCFARDVAAEVGLADPFTRVRAPRSERRNVTERRALSYEQMARLMAYFEVEEPRWLPEVYIMSFTGMRPSELYAVPWDCVDFSRGIIHIRWSYSKGQLNRTKTDDPRDAALTSRMRGLLEAQRDRLVSDGLKTCHLVFPSNCGTYRCGSALRGALLRAATRSGIPIKVGPKTLRKTLITRAALDGHDRLAIRANVGHCDEEMTERYAWVDIEAKRQMVEALETAVQNKKVPSPVTGPYPGLAC